MFADEDKEAGREGGQQQQLTTTTTSTRMPTIKSGEAERQEGKNGHSLVTVGVAGNNTKRQSLPYCIYFV